MGGFAVKSKTPTEQQSITKPNQTNNQTKHTFVVSSLSSQMERITCQQGVMPVPPAIRLMCSARAAMGVCIGRQQE